MENEKPITAQEVWPHLNEEQVREAEANLRRYLEVIARIYERLQREGKEWPEPMSEEELTVLMNRFTIPNERSNSPNANQQQNT